MNMKALAYFHRLKRQGFSHGAARNSTLLMFSSGLADLTKRMCRYVDTQAYPEFLNIKIRVEEPLGSEGDLLNALNRKAHPRFRL